MSNCFFKLDETYNEVIMAKIKSYVIATEHSDYTCVEKVNILCRDGWSVQASPFCL